METNFQLVVIIMIIIFVLIDDASADDNGDDYDKAADDDDNLEESSPLVEVSLCNVSCCLSPNTLAAKMTKSRPGWEGFTKWPRQRKFDKVLREILKKRGEIFS